VIYKMYDIVLVPFPFTDSPKAKLRPALVVSSTQSFSTKIGHSVLAMITSAENDPWPLDVLIKNLEIAGLSKSSVVRMKLFTLDHRLIEKTIGTLSADDKGAIKKTLKSLFKEL